MVDRYGMVSFFPDSITSNISVPNIAITSFELLGTKEKKSISVDGVDEVIIPQDFNVFTIDFSYLMPFSSNHPLANTLRFSLSFDINSLRNSSKSKG